MRFSTLYSSPQGCTCYDNQNRQCAPQYWCNECRNNPSNPNCNMRVGNRIVSRYQTQNVRNIYATPTNRFRNAVHLMPLGTDSDGFGMPMGNSGRDSNGFRNASGVIPTPPKVPICPKGYAQKTYTYLNGKTRTICVPIPRGIRYSD
jgi:hypothetical protein